MAIHGFTTGTLVICTYRMPSALQPWMHEFYVGVVQEPGDDPGAWNGHNSERAYCEATGRVPVRYRAVAHEPATNLRRITTEEAAMSHPEKVLRFLGEEALRNLVGGGWFGAAELLARHKGEPVLAGRPHWLDELVARYGLVVDEARRTADGRALAVYSSFTLLSVWEFRHRATERSGFEVVEDYSGDVYATLLRTGQLADGQPIVVRLCYIEGDVILGVYSSEADALASLDALKR